MTPGEHGVCFVALMLASLFNAGSARGQPPRTFRRRMCGMWSIAFALIGLLHLFDALKPHFAR